MEQQLSLLVTPSELSLIMDAFDDVWNLDIVSMDVRELYWRMEELAASVESQ